MSDRRRHVSADLRARPAALSLKDTLRLLRHSVRRGRGLIDMAPDAIPAPLGSVARGALADFDHIADQVNDFAGRISHRFLDARTLEGPWDDLTLEQIETLDVAEIAFAHAAYRTLSRALRSLGAEDALISELRAAEAFKASIQEAGGDRFAQTAHLVLAMNAKGVVRGAGEPIAEGSASRAEIATLALALWLVAERDDGLDGAEELLDACTAMARA
ncbi:MAG: hypothetical protein AAF321_11945, partial [Pseudomonadota bacterium]